MGLLPRSYGKFRRANCGSHLTPRWREMDSNFQFLAKMGNAFTGAAPSSGASRAMRKAAQPCSAASARIGATLPQRQAARIVIRHPFNPAPYPQHHRWLALSNGLAHDENPAAAVGTRIATSASVRAEKRAVDRRMLVDDEWRFVGHGGPPSAT